MEKALKTIWRLTKINPNIRHLLSFIYRFFNRNKRKIRGKKNCIIVEGAFLKKVKFDVAGDNNHIIIKPGARISNTLFHIRGCGHRIEVKAECVYHGGNFWVEDAGCVITIGEKTYVENVDLIATEPNSAIHIGEGCMLGSDLDIRTGDSHSIIDIMTKKRINYAKDVNIADRVWICSHVRILKGVTIGENSIIGVGSVVTKTIPANCIAAGNPAKVLRTGIAWCAERTYE